MPCGRSRSATLWPSNESSAAPRNSISGSTAAGRAPPASVGGPGARPRESRCPLVSPARSRGLNLPRATRRRDCREPANDWPSLHDDSAESSRWNSRAFRPSKIDRISPNTADAGGTASVTCGGARRSHRPRRLTLKALCSTDQGCRPLSATLGQCTMRRRNPERIVLPNPYWVRESRVVFPGLADASANPGLRCTTPSGLNRFTASGAGRTGGRGARRSRAAEPGTSTATIVTEHRLQPADDFDQTLLCTQYAFDVLVGCGGFVAQAMPARIAIRLSADL